MKVYQNTFEPNFKKQNMKTRVLLLILFSNLNSFSQEIGLIANFPFNNSAVSSVNSEAFTSNISYTTDRNGVANQALSRTMGLSYAAISNLPIGSSERTISVWFRLPTNSGEATFFEYGSGTSNSRFFLAADSFFIPSMQGFSFGAPPFYQLTNYVVTADIWYHYVVTVGSSGTVKQYVNGNLIGTYTGIINTSSDTSCYISGGYNGAIDDLKIYNREITNAEVLSLFNNNTTLSTSEYYSKNMEVKLVPNPVNDVLNIETSLELKSIEIFNTQGQKVLKSNQKQINVSNLSSGIYMIKIQDVENNITTKKVVIK
jgi:hypothetical protein